MHIYDPALSPASPPPPPHGMVRLSVRHVCNSDGGDYDTEKESKRENVRNYRKSSKILIMTFSLALPGPSKMVSGWARDALAPGMFCQSVRKTDGASKTGQR